MPGVRDSEVCGSQHARCGGLWGMWQSVCQVSGTLGCVGLWGVWQSACQVYRTLGCVAVSMPGVWCVAVSMPGVWDSDVCGSQPTC